MDAKILDVVKMSRREVRGLCLECAKGSIELKEGEKCEHVFDK